MRELGVGLGNVIAMAEKILVNEDSIKWFKGQVKENLLGLEMQWMK
jgi:hypothetical protein